MDDICKYIRTHIHYNKEIFLPDVQCPDKEILHEIRKTEMRKILNRETKLNSKPNPSIKKSQSEKIGITDTDFFRVF